jgi:hypothetical protein
MATSDLPSMLDGLHPLPHADRSSMTDPLTASPQWMINDTRCGTGVSASPARARPAHKVLAIILVGRIASQPCGRPDHVQSSPPHPPASRLSERLGLDKSSGQCRGEGLKILGKPDRGVGHRSVVDVTRRSARLLSESACLRDPARDPPSHSRHIPGHARDSS